MPSCPATKSSTSPGTSSGSSRNVPSQRTVTSCSAKPAFMCSPRRWSTSVHVLVVEEEHPLQVRLRRRSRVPAVRRRLIIRQELNRHKAHGNGATTDTPPRATKQLTGGDDSYVFSRTRGGWGWAQVPRLGRGGRNPRPGLYHRVARFLQIPHAHEQANPRAELGRDGGSAPWRWNGGRPPNTGGPGPGLTAFPRGRGQLTVK